MLAMLAVALGLGVYLRWPYYVAGRALDRAEGDKTFASWPAVRTALVNSKSFRDIAPHVRQFHVYTPSQTVRARVARQSVRVSTGVFHSWEVFISGDGRSWSVDEVFSKDWTAELRF